MLGEARWEAGGLNGKPESVARSAPAAHFWEAEMENLTAQEQRAGLL